MESVACLVVPTVTIARSLFNMNCGKLSGVVIPAGCGKTELCKSFQTNKYILLDLEAVLKLELTAEQLTKLDQFKAAGEMASYNNYYYPIAREYINSLRENFKHKNIIVFASDADLLAYCKVGKILQLAPSNKLFEQTIVVDAITKAVGGAPHQDAIKDQLKAGRDSVIRAAGKSLKVYNDFGQLQDMIADKFRLKLKL
jgi:hypothetical protein